jgi:putative ABC transport system permease protein
LTTEAIEHIKALDHVVRVEPDVILYDAKGSLGGKTEGVVAASALLGSRGLRSRLLAGRPFTTEQGRVAIVHEFLLYRWGLIGDAGLAAALGRTFCLEYRTHSLETSDLADLVSRRFITVGDQESQALESALRRLSGWVRFLPIPRDEREALRALFDRLTATSTTKPSRTFAEDFTIVGVIREPDENDEVPGFLGEWNTLSAQVLLPGNTAVEFALRSPEVVESGFNQAFVTVDWNENVKAVARRIRELGYDGFSLAEFLDKARSNARLITLAMSFLAVVALLVAAIGITNTMIMSVLERTHEIGIMKALGARDRHIQLIFLVEGMVLGIAGSGLGLALGWLASFPADGIARSIMEADIRTPVKGTLFLYPAWLVAGVPLLVCVITTLAAWYPAVRAARVDPVTSLRHE